MVKENLEEKTRSSDHRFVIDCIKILMETAVLYFIGRSIRADNLIGKTTLSNKNFYLNLSLGSFSGFTDRYSASKFIFLLNLLPELYVHPGEELSSNIKRIAIKTGVTYGG